jgi:hypothetical protein
MSCQTDLDINSVIDQKTPFTLTIRTVDTTTGLSSTESEVIKVHSAKWNMFVDFAKSNMNGWKSSPASYIGDIFVSQGDFRMIYSQGWNGVVIAFTDKEGNSKQYTKEIDKEELDFLTERNI